ncbi:MAG: hypothetical protein AMXMBFR64_29610 [Myxococcales bacterium]
MSSIWKTIARGFGYLIFFVVALVFFVYVTFPMEQVRGYVEYQAQKRLKMDVRIGELALKGLGGVELWDVVVVLPEKPKEPSAAEEAGVTRPGGPATEAPPAAPRAPAAAKPVDAAKAGATPKAPPKALPKDAAASEGDAKTDKKPKGLRVKIDHVDVSVSLLDVLFGKEPDVRIDAELLGGSISDAHVRKDGKKIRIEAKEVSGLDLTATPLLGYVGPFDVRGKLSGSIDFTWGGSLWDSAGTIELALAQSSIRQPELKSKAYGDFKLTDVKTGALAVKVAVGKKADIATLRAAPGPKDATVVHLEKVESSGEDAELVTEERSVFVLRKGKPFGDASMTVEIAFALSEPFFEREVVRQGEKEKPNKFLKYLLEHDAKWKKAEKNGFYGLRCTGVVKRPECLPVRPTMRVGFAKARTDGGEEPAKDAPEKGDALDTKRPETPAPSARGDQREPGARPTLGTVQDLPRERPTQVEAEPVDEGPQPKVPRIRTPATGVDPKVRIEQLKAEREQRLQEMRAARGLPPEPVAEPLPEDAPLPLDEELVDEVPLDEVPLDDAPHVEGAIDELPLDEDPNFDPDR